MMFFRLTGLAIAATIAFAGSAAAQKIQLRFSMRDARLYALDLAV